MKDRTNEGGIDPVTDKPTDDARRRGALENRDGGKHGDPQERTMIEEILELECPKGRDSGVLYNAKPSRTDGAQRSQNLAAAWTAPAALAALPDAKPPRRSSRREDKRVKANKGAPGIDGMTALGLSCFQAGALAEDCHCD